MRAIALCDNGGPEVLRLTDVPDPVPAAGEVLIEVAYAGVNFAEVEHRRGVFGPAEGWEIPGLEVSGHVLALGDGVTALRPGQPVAAYLPGFGGYAERVAARADFVVPLPEGGPDLRTAGGFGCVGPTAYGVVVAAAGVRPGDTVLVHAAAGGVGSVAAQIARARGAGGVYGTVGDPGKMAYAAGFGYDAVFPRKGFVDAVTEATAGRGVDVVLDPVGGDVRAESLRLLAPFGRLAAYGDAAGQTDLVLPLKEVWKHNRSVTGYNIGDLARRSPRLWREHAAALVDLLMAGTVRIDVTDERPLTDVVEVHRRMEAGESRGKTVLRVGG